MTLEDLEERIAFQRANNLGALILTMPCPKSGLRGEKVRTPFGLAEVMCVNSADQIVFRIELEKVERFIKKARS